MYITIRDNSVVVLREQVKIGIPEDVKIDKTDLSVLFGNLLENAVEACKRLRAGKGKIDVRGQTNHTTGSLNSRQEGISSVSQ